MSHSALPRRVVVILIIGVVLVLGFVVATVLTTNTRDYRHDKALFVCQGVATAIDEYIHHPANKQGDLPRSLNDLVQPPWGGPSLLTEGTKSLIDPWGKSFEMERREKPDGTAYFLVWTTTPEGMKISQFGFGKNADPTFE